MVIARDKIRSFWIDYTCLILNWTSFSLLGFFSTAVIWAHLLKHGFGVKREFLLLNDTVDGDYGAKWWLKEHKLRPSLWSAFRWWWRNHSWNFIRRYNPEWKGGDVDRDAQGRELFETIRSTIDTTFENGRFTRASKINQGVHYIAYVINGRTYAQFSFANRFITVELGTGGDRYRFHLKLHLL